MKRVGAHVSTSGGVENAPLNARVIGARAFAVFVGKTWLIELKGFLHCRLIYGQSRLSWLLRTAIVLFISGMVVPVLMYEKPASGEVNRKEQSLSNTDLVKEAEVPNPKKEAAPLKKEHTDKEEVETAFIHEKKIAVSFQRVSL